MIKVLLFDWGDTVMRDFPAMSGPMAEWEFIDWIPGIEKALQLLSKEYFCAIATNAGASDTALMCKALKRIGAQQYFSFFTSSKDIGIEKPHQDFFIKIAAILGVKPEECVHIGNLYIKDIVGAKKAGMFTVLFNENSIHHNYPAADAVITNMDELPLAIKKLNAPF